MKAFGIIGTWSVDCSKDPRKVIGASRTTFTVPFFGKPTLEMITHVMLGTLDDVQIRHNEILSAALITEDKIQIEFVAVKVENSNQQVTNPLTPPTPIDVILQKMGSQIRVFESWSGDKKFVENGRSTESGVSVPPLEQCLNEFK